MNTCEVTFDVETARIVEWGMVVGNPPRQHESAPSTMLFLAEDVCAGLTGALTNGRVGRSIYTMTVRRNGLADITFHGTGQTVIYELFPLRFNDQKPYEPLCYVGRWPD